MAGVNIMPQGVLVAPGNPARSQSVVDGKRVAMTFREREDSRSLELRASQIGAHARVGMHIRQENHMVVMDADLICFQREARYIDDDIIYLLLHYIGLMS